MALKEQQKAKQEQGKEYFMKVEGLKSEMESLINSYKHMNEFTK